MAIWTALPMGVLLKPAVPNWTPETFAPTFMPPDAALPSTRCEASTSPVVVSIRRIINPMCASSFLLPIRKPPKPTPFSLPELWLSNSVTVPLTRIWALTSFPVCADAAFCTRPLLARSCSLTTSFRVWRSMTTNCPLCISASVSWSAMPSPSETCPCQEVLFSKRDTATIFFKVAAWAAGNASAARIEMIVKFRKRIMSPVLFGFCPLDTARKNLVFVYFNARIHFLGEGDVKSQAVLDHYFFRPILVAGQADFDQMQAGRKLDVAAGVPVKNAIDFHVGVSGLGSDFDGYERARCVIRRFERIILKQRFNEFGGNFFGQLGVHGRIVGLHGLAFIHLFLRIVVPGKKHLAGFDIHDLDARLEPVESGAGVHAVTGKVPRFAAVINNLPGQDIMHAGHLAQRDGRLRVAKSRRLKAL